MESVVPIFVWVLEGLANCKTQLRDKEVEVERERAEREHLLERYQAERTLRKECQEVGSCDVLDLVPKRIHSAVIVKAHQYLFYLFIFFKEIS